MPIRFACPSCGQPLLARDDKVGRKLKCPKCRKTLVVPTESQPRGETAGELTGEARTGEMGDRAARGAARPEAALPQQKTAAAGRVPTRPAPKQDHPSLQAILDLGGQYARAGEGGRFYLQLVPG